MASKAPSRPDDPGPHHDPPSGFKAWELPIVDVAEPWFRVHPLGLDPLFFGRKKMYRFDAPAAEYGVLYVGKDEHTAFIETFGHATRSATGRGLVTATALKARGLARIESLKPLRLVDLRGPGLARIGADGRLQSGSRMVARRWSRALHEHPDAPDGILYRARHDPSRQAAAIFDRAKAAVKAIDLGSLADPSLAPLLGSILDSYNFALIAW